MGAYSFWMICVFLLFGAMIVVALTPMLNLIINDMNGRIEHGDVSVQTRDTFQWNLNYVWWIPGIMVFGVVIWAYIRSIEIARVQE